MIEVLDLPAADLDHLLPGKICFVDIGKTGGDDYEFEPDTLSVCSEVKTGFSFAAFLSASSRS